jgi:hypothetical protein
VPERKPSQSARTNGSLAPNMPPQNAPRPRAKRASRLRPMGRRVNRLTTTPVAIEAAISAE